MNVMFVHIPKTAGTSIEKSLKLIRARTPSKFKNNFTNNGQYSFGHLDVRKRLKNGAISKEFYESAFKFCFCRNPYDRAVSHYFYARKRHPDKFSPEVSFLDFSRTIGDYGKMFRTQTYYTKGLGFDFIGRFESLYEDVAFVAKTTGVEINLLKLNTTQHNPYWTYYADESKENIENFYKEDFDFFNYGQDHNLLHRESMP